MSFHHAVPCVMTNTDQFFVRICGCGVVHMSFGCTVVNVSSEAAIAIAETLMDIAIELKIHASIKDLESKKQAPVENLNNVILGNF